MKIGIVTTYVPFVRGGAEILAENLRDKLIEYGHEAIIINIPFKWYPSEKIIEHILATRLINVANVDRVIALKFPAYFVQHGNKVLWLLHQFRQVYELWGTDYQDLPDTPEGNTVRDIIIHCDNQFLPEAKKIYTNSNIVGERLRNYNNIESSILFPPLMNPENYFCEQYGDFFFYPSRITRGKRQFLAVQAMKYTKSPAKLVIAGSPEHPEDLKMLHKIIREDKTHKKVTIIDYYISEEEKVQYYASCRGCIYIPYDEDSYGYVTLESYHAKKPVITCDDSGDTTVLVHDGRSGFVTSSDPKEIALAIDKMYYDSKLAQKMGECGLEIVKKLNISWDYVIRGLTE